MTPQTPNIEPLSRRHRMIAFFLAIFLFVTMVPLLVFYAIGYRIDLNNKAHNITSVGGLYISADARNTEMYVDNTPVQNARVFQRALYVQDVTAGMHEVHVQRTGLTTWVKNLPVFPHFVTVAASFNIPLVPQVRPITPYETVDGAAVVRASSSLADLLARASSTVPVYVATSSIATSTYVKDPEYAYVTARFASTTADRTILKELANQSADRFTFASLSPRTIPTTTATSTVVSHDMQLREESDGEVYATWLGQPDQVPYYFCVNPDTASSTADLYGTHVAAAIYGTDSSGNVLATTTASSTLTFPVSGRICRKSIKIDRLRQTVHWFNFVPGNSDLVLMHLDDGIYVVEIDDRSWQNTELLYPGKNLTMLVDGNTIYIKDGNNYLEVYTEEQK